MKCGGRPSNLPAGLRIGLFLWALVHQRHENGAPQAALHSNLIWAGGRESRSSPKNDTKIALNQCILFCFSTQLSAARLKSAHDLVRLELHLEQLSILSGSPVVKKFFLFPSTFHSLLPAVVGQSEMVSGIRANLSIINLSTFRNKWNFSYFGRTLFKMSLSTATQ